MTDRSSRALAARRVHIVERDRLAGVVVDIDATDDPRAGGLAGVAARPA
ncbi:MAG: hypothetical protein R2701_07700 [Acidimicrobiales bacterium]